jgi:hypothetical protein
LIVGKSFIISLELLIAFAAGRKSEEIIRRELQSLIGGGDAIVVSPRPIQDKGDGRGLAGIAGVELIGFLDFGVGFVIATPGRKHEGVPMASYDMAGIELFGSLKFGVGSFPVVVLHRFEHGEHGVRLGHGVIERQSLFGRGPGFGFHFARRKLIAAEHAHVGSAHGGVGFTRIGIEPSGGIEEIQGFEQIVGGAFVPIKSGLACRRRGSLG